MKHFYCSSHNRHDAIEAYPKMMANIHTENSKRNSGKFNKHTLQPALLFLSVERVLYVDVFRCVWRGGTLSRLHHHRLLQRTFPSTQHKTLRPSISQPTNRSRRVAGTTHCISTRLRIALARARHNINPVICIVVNTHALRILRSYACYTHVHVLSQPIFVSFVKRYDVICWCVDIFMLHWRGTQARAFDVCWTGRLGLMGAWIVSSSNHFEKQPYHYLDFHFVH